MGPFYSRPLVLALPAATPAQNETKAAMHTTIAMLNSRLMAAFFGTDGYFVPFEVTENRAF
jgi:hypothetical protein